MADPGFPVGGGVDLVGRAVDSRGGYISKILHVKTKEFGPLGGHAPGTPPSRSANAQRVNQLAISKKVPNRQKILGMLRLYVHLHSNRQREEQLLKLKGCELRVSKGPLTPKSADTPISEHLC